MKDTTIERKFIVNRPILDNYLTQNPPTSVTRITQGFIADSNDWSVRIRFVSNKTGAELSIKSQKDDDGYDFYTYSIPYADGERILKDCSDTIVKDRLLIPYGGKLWEIDIFSSHALSLCQVDTEHHEEMTLPPFVGEEVTDNIEYNNINIAKRRQYRHSDSMVTDSSPIMTE